MRIRRCLFGCFLLSAVLLVLTVDWTAVHGCAPAPHPGQWVDIRDESALILWDAETKTEHFIRRASIQTAAADFGFLVPTPTRPELGEADDAAFQTLTRRTAPRHVYQVRGKTVFGFGNLLPNWKGPGAPPPTSAMPKVDVEVLEQKQVAGFDASVLKADDPQALADWLDEHGYEARPALVEWLKWFVEHKWIITAFKLVKGVRPHFDARSVRMTFQAEKPVYLYCEPADMRNPGEQGSRTLRVFLLADQRCSKGTGEKGRSVTPQQEARSIENACLRINSNP